MVAAVSERSPHSDLHELEAHDHSDVLRWAKEILVNSEQASEHGAAADVLKWRLAKRVIELEEQNEFHKGEVVMLSEKLDDLHEQLETMRQALSVVASLDPDWTQRDGDSVYAIARAALGSNLRYQWGRPC